jgi:hypothetical protein
MRLGVLTGEQPPPHATAADAARSVDLVERYGLMAAGIGWTCGVLSQTGQLGILSELPAQLRLTAPDGTRVLGVHASPQADSGPGISPDKPDDVLRPLFEGCGADVVLGGHTHRATDREINGIRALNPGSVGIPMLPGQASWLVLEFADDPQDERGVRAEHRLVPFDVDATVRDLRSRLHPNTEFLESVLTGRSPQRRESDPA